MSLAGVVEEVQMRDSKHHLSAVLGLTNSLLQLCARPVVCPRSLLPCLARPRQRRDLRSLVRQVVGEADGADREGDGDGGEAESVGAESGGPGVKWGLLQKSSQSSCVSRTRSIRNGVRSQLAAWRCLMTCQF